MFYIINYKRLQHFCHVEMTAKGGCFSRVEGSVSEGDMGTTGNMNNIAALQDNIDVACAAITPVTL
jgi:hypothetical protein